MGICRRFVCVGVALAVAAAAGASAGEKAERERPEPLPAEKNPVYYSELAAVNMRYGEYEKAAELYKKAIELQPGDNIDEAVAYGLAKAYLELGEVDKADATLELPLKTMEQSKKPRYLMAVAQLHKDKGRYEKAEEALLLAREEGKGDERAQMRVTEHLMELYKGTPLGKKARAEFEERLEKNPKDGKAIKALMDLYLYDSDIEKATQMAVRYAELNPDSVSALKDLSFFYAASGEMEKMVEVCEKLIEKDPENKADYYARIMYIYNDQKNLDKVVEWADKAAKDGVSSAATYAALADSYLKAEQEEQALQCYKKAMEANPKNNRYKYHYARLLAKTGNTKEAKEILEPLTQLKDANLRHLAQQALLSIYKKEAGQDE